MKMTGAFRNHLIFTIFAVTTVSPYSADGKSVKDMFAEVSSSIVVVLTLDAGGRKTGQGSGVVVGKNEVVTNCHVVSNARTIVVRQAADVRGRETYRMKAELVARNEQRDLCLLSVKELSVPPAAPPVIFAAARSVSIGEEVYAIGAPQGLDLSLSRGIISQLRGNYGKQSAPIIQTDAAISPGSSGGGLFNENGELLGITTFKFSGGASEGLSFALPVEWVKALVVYVQKRKQCFSSPTVECLFDEALRIEKSIDTGTASLTLINETLCAIATAQAEADDKVGAKMTLTDAMHIAERIDKARERDGGFSNIAAVQIEARDIVGAMQTAGRINNPIERASTLNKIAAAQTKAGNRLGARLTLETAIQVLEKFKKSIAQTESEATTPSKSWVEVGLKSLDVASLPNSIRSIAKTQAMAGYITEALQTVGKIDDVDDFFLAYRANGFLDIATVQIEAGDTTGAKTTLTNARQAAEKINDTNQYFSVLSEIATAQAQVSHEAGTKVILTDALHATMRIDDVGTRGWRFLDIAVAQAEMGNIVGALQTTERIDAPHQRFSALSKIATLQAEAGDIVGATQIAKRINNVIKRISALGKIAIAQAQAGDEAGAKIILTDALHTAMRIDDAKWRISALREIGAAQAQAGDKIRAKNTFTNAIQVIEEINARNTFGEKFMLSEKEQSRLDAVTTANTRLSTLRDIAVAQAEAGDIKGAMDTALHLSHGVIVEDKIALELLASETKAKRAVALARIAVAISRIK